MRPGRPVVGVGLSQRNVTGENLRALAPLQNLTTLDLSDTGVTNAGLKELAPLKNLTTLDLRDTKVTDEGGQGTQEGDSELSNQYLTKGTRRVVDEAPPARVTTRRPQPFGSRSGGAGPRGDAPRATSVTGTLNFQAFGDVSIAAARSLADGYTCSFAKCTTCRVARGLLRRPRPES
jgi:hypothetical protein